MYGQNNDFGCLRSSMPDTQCSGKNERQMVAFGHLHADTVREGTFRRYSSGDSGYFPENADRYVADIGGRRIRYPDDLSRSAASRGIRIDGTGIFSVPSYPI